MTPTETIETRLASILREPMTASQAAQLDTRLSDAGARNESASRPDRARASTGRGLFRRRLVLAVGLALLLLTSLVVSLPIQSKPTFEAQLRALGVPEGVELGAVGMDRDGLDFALYTGSDGVERCVGRTARSCRGMRHLGPNGTVLYDGGPAFPGATATPHP